MTLHLNASESVAHKILSFLDSLTRQGESVEIIDDSLYKYEKSGISNGLAQIQNNQYSSAEDLLTELSK